MRKPNAIKHMALYGLVYGLLLAMIYIWVFFLLIGTAGTDGSLGDLAGAVLWTGFFAFLFGALPGAVMGLIEGVILWRVLRDVTPPLDSEAFARYTSRAYRIVGVLTLFGMGSIMWFFFGDVNFIVLVPIIIATGAALYAVRRYMLKLHVWGGMGKPKEKHKIG